MPGDTMSRSDRLAFVVCCLVLVGFTVALMCWGPPLY